MDGDGDRARDDGWTRAAAWALVAAGAAAAATGVALLLAYLPALDDPYAAFAPGSAMSGARSAHFWAASAIAATGAAWLAQSWMAPAASRLARVAPIGLILGLMVLFGTGELLGADQRAAEGWAHVRAASGALGFDLHRDIPYGGVLAAHVVGVLIVAASVLRLPLRASRKLAFGTALSAVGVILVLAFALPVHRGPRALALAGNVDPIWPLLWLVPVEGALGARGLVLLGVLGTVAGGAAMLLAPRIHQAARRGVALVAGLGFGLLSIIGLNIL